MASNNFKHPHLRPLDPRRDLEAVADLIDLCFDFHMDEDGREYVQQIRRAAQAQNSIFGGSYRVGSGGVPMQGFVWEEDRKLVGNLTIIPFLRGGKWHFLIANVATNPMYRLRGIAREMTQAALKYIREHNGVVTWLQVREDNPAARHLYETLGFKEIAHRTTYRSPVKAEVIPPASDTVILTSRRKSDWPIQNAWLKSIYPPEIAWHLPLDLHRLEPGFLRGLLRILNDETVNHWCVRRGDRLLGTASLETGRGNCDTLWLGVPAIPEEDALFTLLTRVRAETNGRRAVTVNFPSGVAEKCFRLAGFEKHLTLVWMNNHMNQGQKTTLISESNFSLKA
jgi:ribosomal protein S18 acetylase RimI-like enzyme